MKAVSDRLIMEASGELLGPEVLVILLNGTTLATGLRSVRPELNYTFYTPEHFFLKTLQHFHPECVAVEPPSRLPEGTPNPSTHDTSFAFQGTTTEGSVLRLICDAEPPCGEFDSIAFPTNAMGTAEQTQELLQAAHQRLRTGGRLIVSTNNPKDKWLHERLRELFDKTTVCSSAHGVVYVARKQSELKKVKDFRAVFAFRFREQLVYVESLPGVFSHRRVDGGARALIHSLEMAQQRTTSAGGKADGQADGPKRIVDLGCGSGAVAVAAAIGFPNARVLAIDSHARAVQCAAATAARNQIDRVDVMLSSEAEIPGANSWDLVLTNPPYYSDFRISELFLQAARNGLRPGGYVHLVTKLTDWHLARMNQLFVNVESQRIGEYDVLTARKQPG